VTKQLNGQLEADEREALRVGVEGRHRLFKLNPANLLVTDAGTFVGRLRLAGSITMQQCQAATRYAEAFHEMQIALGGPKGSGAVNLNATHGMPGVENVDRSIKAMQRKQDEMHGTSNLYAALDYCVIRDADCPHMLRWLKIALDVLAVEFQIGDKPVKRADCLLVGNQSPLTDSANQCQRFETQAQSAHHKPAASPRGLSF
jgi:hypothetical protein